MHSNRRLLKLETKLRGLYVKHSQRLLFHGWHHINFVRKKAILFAKPIKADIFIVESAALVHDLNYIVKFFSKARDGAKLRAKLLDESGYTDDEIAKIENVIIESETATRNEHISLEGKALSDADALFKALPITPIIFSSRYMTENKIDIQVHVKKIITEQRNLVRQGIFFYTPLAKKKYLGWIENQIVLWEYANSALKDPEVKEMLRIARQLSII